MLATAGFITTGIFFWVFTLGFLNLVVAKTGLKLKAFAYAYYCLGLALMIWGVASYIGSPEALARSVIIGDAILLLGTVLMLSVYTRNKLLLSIAFLAAAALIFVRVRHYYPQPYIKNSLLIFNTQTPVAVMLSAILSLIWMPINLRVSSMVTQTLKQPSLRSLFFMTYSLANIAALIFISAKRPLIAGLSFSALAVCFLLLIYSNFLVAKIEDL